MRGFALAVVLFLFWSESIAQLRGIVKNQKDDTPIPAVNILVKNPQDSVTLAFGVTDIEGFFSIDIQIPLDTVLIQARSMTIQPVLMKVKNSSLEIEILALTTVLDLDEFTVDGIKNPISIRNDTISYDVSGFYRASDRVIGDVIKRLPGLEVSGNGMISYEGRPLQKFYIEGLDLLEGRYNLANSTIAADAVESIQILENHQPIRVLDSLVFSDRASLNIKLKKKNVWSGTGEAGLGLSPLLWDSEFSPMLFSSRFQTLNSIRTNSIGENYENQSVVLTVEDLKSSDFSTPLIAPWVQVDNINSGLIPSEKLFFNKSHLWSVNTLSKLKNESEFRLNIGHIHQDLSAFGKSSSTIYFPQADTISFSEEKTIKMKPVKTWGDLTLTKNIAKSFLSNKVSFQIFRHQDRSETLFAGLLRNQNAKLPFLTLANSFQLIKPFFGVLAEVKSELSYQGTDQHLEVSPSLFLVSESGSETPKLLQKVSFDRLFTNNSVGFSTKLSRKISYSPNIGFKFMSDVLNSGIGGSTLEDEGQSVFYSNHSSYEIFNTYLKQSFQFKNEKWTFQLDLPLKVQRIQIQDHFESSKSTKSSQVFFEPYFYSRYQFSGKIYSTFTLKKSNDFGTLYEKFSGRVFRNFRTIYQLNSNLPELIGANYSLGLYFKDPVTSWFISGRLSLNNYLRNTVSQNLISPLGETIISAMNLENESKTLVSSVQLSKYFSSIYSTLSGSASFQNRVSPRIINDALTEINIQTTNFGLSYLFKPRKILGLSFQSTFYKFENGFGKEDFNQVFFLTHTGQIEFFPSDNVVFGIDYNSTISWASINSSKSSTKFLDFSYRWIIPNSKWELGLEVQNILNNKKFESFTSSSNFMNFQSLQLRPRQGLVKILFKF
ncbi:hypothetical protein [Algoriphagus sp. CAU 1675]|uniref:hypothetical protein n=1 Tax=Algoriphagus sp. CAU 1675 TaxID=3032597 RepID=UPI0023DC6126|nr:hypothetical protein [Algoriphagus sp. CAU 1675]MDF2157522.1 hypothetical protein [Algoriphagus sp. CAU 1675]